MNWPATIANSLWVGSSLPAWRSFRRALKRPAEVQRTLLQRLIETNSACSYGCAHRFGAIGSYEEFTRTIPVVDYEDLTPWIHRIQLGEADVLTKERVTHLIPTSGSTGGRKLIPFTAGLQQDFNRAIGPWIADLVREHPGILFGPAYWSISPPARTVDPDESIVPVGFENDASYLGGMKSRLVRETMVAPCGMAEGIDLQEFRYRTLTALLQSRDLRLISVWHPSFLTLLLDALPGLWGRICGQLISERSDRARELEAADPHRPESIWPHLRVISCWGDGHAELALADLRRRFRRVVVQPKGLLATEAIVTIPFMGMQPVSLRSHFFEFFDEQNRIRPIDELRLQETYEVIVTTSGGLWRYRLGDRVQVTGFLGRTPSLRFVGRCGNVSDLCGEKLAETFVADAIRKVLKEFSFAPRFVLLAPERDTRGARYILWIEGAAPGGLDEAVDLMLRGNPHYANCRDLDQLAGVEVCCIAEGGYELFVGRLLSEGARLGEIKPTSLSRLTGWTQVFSAKHSLPR